MWQVYVSCKWKIGTFNGEFETNWDLLIFLGVTFSEFSFKYILGYASAEIRL